MGHGGPGTGGLPLLGSFDPTAAQPASWCRPAAVSPASIPRSRCRRGDALQPRSTNASSTDSGDFPDGRRKDAEGENAPASYAPAAPPCGSARQPQAARGSGGAGRVQVEAGGGQAPCSPRRPDPPLPCLRGPPGQSFGRGAWGARISGKAPLPRPPAGLPLLSFASLAHPGAGAGTMQAALSLFPL